VYVDGDSWVIDSNGVQVLFLDTGALPLDRAVIGTCWVVEGVAGVEARVATQESIWYGFERGLLFGSGVFTLMGVRWLLSYVGRAPSGGAGE
jgi:hypothetical protein